MHELKIFTDTPENILDSTMRASKGAFQIYKNTSPSIRKKLMYTIAEELQAKQSLLIEIAHAESHLPIDRLKQEINRTCIQLQQYADATEEGAWMQATIDNLPDPQPNLRKCLMPVGPVVVFGSSNFPFAYSTAGGDTASALAAGCSVVIKAHPAHPNTSTLVWECIVAALEKNHLPREIVQHIYGASHEVGKYLVMHENTAAIGFTGSFTGGTQLHQWAQQRPKPIPVFAEMGSVNPIILSELSLQRHANEIAEKIAQSLTLHAGQYCTNPGLLLAVESPSLGVWKERFIQAVRLTPTQKMLHRGIWDRYQTLVEERLNHPSVQTLLFSEDRVDEFAYPVLAEIHAKDFLNNSWLGEEVFGPFQMLILAKDIEELIEVYRALPGQLTTTCWIEQDEHNKFQPIFDLAILKAGRLIWRGVPTGVSVTTAMHHGGPFPVTIDGRFSSVGQDAIQRFARPVSFQNWPDQLLPEPLQAENPWKICRRVNGKWN
ncbi:MAG: aldehyde dehydrogenase (NADP(+)) [Hydrotalea sp.]|nr:aldehyde dehydrogenase (NADP(+)) [Hydrotalea sp.]